MPKKDTIVRHHLLEILYYIDENGNKITINNSVERLKKLGIYYDWKMCIEMTQSEHIRLHMTNLSTETRARKSKVASERTFSDETRAKMSKAKSNMSDETKKKLSESHLGKTLSKESREKVSENSAVPRLAKEYKAYKDAGGTLKWNDWKHERKLKQKEQKSQNCKTIIEQD